MYAKKKTDEIKKIYLFISFESTQLSTPTSSYMTSMKPWRWYFDIFVLGVYMPLVMGLYIWLFRLRHTDTMKVRHVAIYFAHGISGTCNILCVVIQDLLLLNGSGDFPCVLIMLTSMQTIPFSPFIAAIHSWNLVYAFNPSMKANAPRWLIHPKKYWTVTLGFFSLFSIPFTAFYFRFARWRPELQQIQPGVFCVCVMSHEYWFYIPIVLALVIATARARPYIKHINDYYGLGAEARLMPFIGLISLTCHMLNVMGQWDLFDRPWWDRHAIPINFLAMAVPIRIHFMLFGHVMLVYRGTTLLTLTGRETERLLPHRRTSSTIHPSRLTLMESFELAEYRPKNSHESPTRRDDDDATVERKNDEDVAESQSLDEIIANSDLLDIMLLHSRKAFSAENIIFIQRFAEFKTSLRSAISNSIKNTSSTSSSPLHSVRINAFVSTNVTPRTPSMQISPTMAARNEMTVMFATLLPSSLVTLTTAILPLIHVIQADFIDEDSPFELNISINLRRSCIKQIKNIRIWLDTQPSLQQLVIDGHTELDDHKERVLSLISRDPPSNDTRDTPLFTFLTTSFIDVYKEVHMLVQTNLYLSFLVCAPYKAYTQRHRTHQRDVQNTTTFN